MADRLERARELAAQLSPEWGDEQIDRTLSRVHGGIRRRRVARGVGLALCGVLAIVGATTVWRSGNAPASLVEHRAPLRLDDGTTATPLSNDTQIVTTEVTPQAATVRLPLGAARFKVKKGRKFRVDAGAVQIDVLGTEFDVVHAGPERVSVVVAHGTVRVGWKGGQTILEAGQRGTFPPEKAALPAPPPAPVEPRPQTLVAPAPEPPPEPPPPAVEPKPRAPRAKLEGEGDDWRALARQGSFSDAYVIMERSAPPADTIEDLLLAADVARLSGHAGEAVPHLVRGLKLAEQGRDDRAAIAAFTLGRLLLEQLGKSREAAMAFQRARDAAPDGPLAEDALAREVEAWARAKDPALARARAELYLSRYPDGRRAEHVRRLGGVE